LEKNFYKLEDQPPKLGAIMIARQATHSLNCECEEEAAPFLELANSSSRFAIDGTSRNMDHRKIVSLSEDIVWIEGTLSVAF
jgi:hypothetical protein